MGYIVQLLRNTGPNALVEPRARNEHEVLNMRAGRVTSAGAKSSLTVSVWEAIPSISTTPMKRYLDILFRVVVISVKDYIVPVVKKGLTFRHNVGQLALLFSQGLCKYDVGVATGSCDANRTLYRSNRDSQFNRQWIGNTWARPRSITKWCCKDIATQPSTSTGFCREFHSSAIYWLILRVALKVKDVVWT